MSILNKEWVLKYKRRPDESLWAALLASRQIQDPGNFFSNSEISDLHDPFLFPDMQRAVERVQNAIHARERIVVYGDYDVDGISGAALLIHTLRFLGAEVSYRIPHRMEDGYGLHQKYVRELIDQNVSLLITVDLGISCVDEVAFAQKNKLDVIITDHHTIPKKDGKNGKDGKNKVPKAFAILHPLLAKNYPFKHLSGSGVAFKLASALLIATKNEDLIPTLTDLASLGTVADCVPLTGENRTIVKLGLRQMTQTRWDGLRAILKSAGAWDDQNFTTYTIGYQVGPRLNASGRIDHPYWALQTLLAEGSEAEQKSKKLELLNRERQELTRSIQEEAEASIDFSQPIIIAEGKGWSSGIVGLIAGRIQEKYGKPTFILEDRGDTLVGSARSMPGFHAVDAIAKAANLLKSFGGHEQAAGFHLKKENYSAFKKILLSHAEKILTNNPIKAQFEIDLELLPGEGSLDQIEKLNGFAPFGIANQKPVFLLDNVTILNIKPVGRTEDHLKFTAKFADDVLEGIAFNFAKHAKKLAQAKQILINLELNEWNGAEKPQLKLVDFAS